jgi:hypothetical protein
MRKLATAMFLMLLVGCTSATEYGSCIGAFDDRDPKLTYKVSIWNAFLAIIFVETIIVPIWVVVDETLCPVGRKS